MPTAHCCYGNFLYIHRVTLGLMALLAARACLDPRERLACWDHQDHLADQGSEEILALQDLQVSQVPLVPLDLQDHQHSRDLEHGVWVTTMVSPSFTSTTSDWYSVCIALLYGDTD